MFWTPALTLLAASAPQVLASCAYGTHLHPRAEPGEFVAPTFGYTGTTGPANWLAIDPQVNAACATGQNQSPIDMAEGSFTLVEASAIKLDVPDFTEGAEFENLGTTIEVIAENLNATMQLGNTTFDLKQFHYHLPSEHLDNGTSMAMEMHMVWASQADEIAVVGVYIDLDDAAAAAALKPTKAKGVKTKGIKAKAANNTAAHSKLVETVLQSADKIPTPGSSTHTEPLVMSELVKVLEAGSFQTYGGSLTTPPCSEGVNWLVSTQKISVSTSAYIKARSVIGFNARFPQNAPGQENVLTIASRTKAVDVAAEVIPA